MTETGSTVERLRHQCEHRSGQTEWYAIDYGELEALLAVVEAAQDVADAGVETENGWFVDLDALLRLNHRLEALHSQASDEGKP